ncbi:SMI1/KNR4 family protein [Oceanirhabdus sp. W0125-5]|uniref:SMI1/KNR4 family protein n=1 Tax=Oceanirhabdus sp. W0125-5 TaxID=2999116 RepID=UPI0022F31B4D|nr:SMI1/KNR4 family protein [Oceanirhabdus sp. W0125-5]WBW97143.1 SMI1/KNR4 family protein [Oceanirhabdus sp. W0125-5]
MSMEEKLEFLRQYNDKIELINVDENNEVDFNCIPSEWYRAFSEKDSEKRIDIVLDLWEKNVNTELRNTIAYLSENIDNIELMKCDERYSILYSIRTSEGDIEYFEGRNPHDKINNSELEKVWGKFPTSIRNFYENVHNGFYFFASQAMGLVPLESVTYFDEDEWGIIEELKEPLQIDLKTTFGFFKSGMGGYVAIDYKNCINDNATLWFSNNQPKYNINFWDIVDEWIVIGFE